MPSAPRVELWRGDVLLGEFGSEREAVEAAYYRALESRGEDVVHYEITTSTDLEVDVARIRKIVLDPDFEPPSVAMISLEQDQYVLNESTSNDIVVRRLGNTSQTVAVDWAATNLSGPSLSGTVNFSEGETEKTFSFTTGALSSDESGQFVLSNPRSTSGGPAPVFGQFQTADVQVLNAPDPGLWTLVSLGDDATGDITVNSDQSLTFEAAGTNDPDNGQFAYQQIDEGVCQISGRLVAGWSGTLENFTMLGLQVRQSLEPGSPMAQIVWANIGGGTRPKSRVEQNGPIITDENGPGVALPLQVAITVDPETTDSVNRYASTNGGATWFRVGEPVPLPLSYPFYIGGYMTSHNNAELVQATINQLIVENEINITQQPTGPRSVRWTLAFETGEIQPRQDNVDDAGGLAAMIAGDSWAITNISKASPAVFTYSGAGNPANLDGLTISGVGGMTQANGFLIRPKNINTTAKTFQAYVDHVIPGSNPESQDQGNVPFDTRNFSNYSSGGLLQAWEQVNTGNQGGGGPTSGLDARVVESATIGADSNVQPRNGDFFLRSAIYYNRDYSVFSGNNGKNKPRFTINHPIGLEFDWDQEVYAGWSIYLPTNLPDETAGHTHVYENMCITCVGESASRDHWQLVLRVPEGESVMHWIMKYQLRDDSVMQNPDHIEVDLGEVVKGAWQDFVVRYRANPFSVTTNAGTISGGKNQTYQGNRGIFQLWWGEAGAEMDRMMNFVNVPMGLVPENGAFLRFSVRNYKYGWHHHPTSITGSIEMGFDEFRYGRVEQDGTGFSDVHPTQQAGP